MIGNMDSPLSGAIGEGMSDTVAMLVNGDDKMGEYSASDPNGIRRYPYAGYPLTYADVTGAEVQTTTDLRRHRLARLIELFGPSRRNDLFDYMVDGMNFTVTSPAYEDMRDGILQSVANGPKNPGDRCRDLERVCAVRRRRRRQGVVNPNNSVTISPSFTKPGDCPERLEAIRDRSRRG